MRSKRSIVYCIVRLTCIYWFICTIRGSGSNPEHIDLKNYDICTNGCAIN